MHRFLRAAAVLSFAATLLVPVRAGAADRRDFYLANRGSEPIFYVRVSHISEDKWGDDILGEDVLEPGERVKITFHDDQDLCYYDIQVQYKDGDKREQRDVDLCSTDTVSFYH